MCSPIVFQDVDASKLPCGDSGSEDEVKNRRSSAASLKNDPENIAKMQSKANSISSQLGKAKLQIMKALAKMNTLPQRKQEVAKEGMKDAKDIVVAALENVELVSMRTTEETILQHYNFRRKNIYI